jgi:hypothetical protein
MAPTPRTYTLPLSHDDMAEIHRAARRAQAEAFAAIGAAIVRALRGMLARPRPIDTAPDRALPTT